MAEAEVLKDWRVSILLALGFPFRSTNGIHVGASRMLALQSANRDVPDFGSAGLSVRAFYV